jgi:hypothetical protein
MSAFEILVYNVIPYGISSIVTLVDHVIKGKDVTTSGILKQTLSRFWRLVGSTFLFSLILFGIYAGLFMLFGLVFL